MTEEKNCYNCGNKNCNVYYSMPKKDYKRHFETYEYTDFDCVNHDKWEEMKVEEIRTDNTEKLKNALERIAEFEKEIAELKEKFLTVKKDDVRKEKLNECKTFEEKVEYLRQVSNYALFNEDISVMFWCFYQRGEIDAEQIAKTKELIEKLLNAFASNDFFEEEELDAMAEAEQFLKETEE